MNDLKVFCIYGSWKWFLVWFRNGYNSHAEIILTHISCFKTTCTCRKKYQKLIFYFVALDDWAIVWIHKTISYSYGKQSIIHIDRLYKLEIVVFSMYNHFISSQPDNILIKNFIWVLSKKNIFCLLVYVVSHQK